MLAAVLGFTVVAPLALGTTDGVTRALLLTTMTVLSIGLLVLARPSVPARFRSVGVVVAFVVTAAAGYATFGFLSGPGVALAVAVVCSGLLLDRRSMFVTLGLCVACLTVIGSLMVAGVLPEPQFDDVSPGRAGPWLRSSSLTVMLLAVIGAAVSLVVRILEDAVATADESSRRQREAELQILHAQSTQLVGQLAAGLAHDLNNQLTVIGWWSSVLAETQDEDERRRAAEVVARSIDAAASLTRRLLVAGRRDAPTPRPVQLARFLEANSTLLRAVVPPGVELTVDADDDAWVRIDPSRLSQILINLATNAGDATPDGGGVTISARRVSDGEESFFHGDGVVVTVEDDGVGMDDETRVRALEPFFTTRTADGGSGLGLPTASALTEEAGGRLHISSTPGQGTRISVWFPAAEPGAHEREPVAGEPVSLDGVRVLLAEDNPDVLAVARLALADAGAVVTVAVDGDDALRRVDTGPFDVLCTDVVMPGAPVSEVLLRFCEAHPEGAVLLCSGYVGEELVRRGIEEGRFRLLRKPYRPAELTRAVAQSAAAADG